MRKTSLALIAIGAFLIVLAPMVRWYAYPRLAVAPANERSVTYLEAKGATIFDPGTLKNITTDLSITVHTTGDAQAPKHYPGSVTYVNTTVTSDASGTMRAINPDTGAVIVRGEVERETFNARTGEATPKVKGDFISDSAGSETAVTHQGLVAKFPFDTQKKDYTFWDATVRAAAPIQYQGTQQFHGLTVYTFHQTLAPQKTGTQSIPLSLLGLPGSQTVDADQMYSVDRTLLVEPETGVIIQRTEKVKNTLDYQGQPRLTLTDATVQYAARSVDKNVNDYGAQGRMLGLVRSIVPGVAFVLGLLSLIAGIVLGRRKATTGDASVQQREHAHA